VRPTASTTSAVSNWRTTPARLCNRSARLLRNTRHPSQDDAHRNVFRVQLRYHTHLNAPNQGRDRRQPGADYHLQSCFAQSCCRRCVWRWDVPAPFRRSKPYPTYSC
jgi:hypothetical protein